MKYYGFTFMRNVERLDYPFVEVMHSLCDLTERVYVALGDSDDRTEEMLGQFDNIEIIKTVWEDSMSGDGGKIFSHQANLALEELRKNHRGEEDAWAIFLHCDEVVHPREYKKLIADIERAHAEDYDAVKLRFLHFWKDHYHIAICKRWHPAEVRAMKVDSDVVCHGDAQGFSGARKEYDSDVSVFHYGHVREADQHDAKQREILRRIRPAEKFKKYYKREKKIFAKTRMLRILIDHPNFFKERLERLGDDFHLPEVEEIYIVGNREKYSEEIAERINSSKVNWVGSIKDVPRKFRKEKMVIMEDSRRFKCCYRSQVPDSMFSPQAKPWDPDMMLILKLSEKNVSIKPL
jgi:hypothetical protein